MNRVRPLHEKTCQELLESRSRIMEDLGESADHSTDENPVAQFNRYVEQLREEHGKPWCDEHAIVPFPGVDFRFSVVMPVYNEAKTIASMIDRVCRIELPLELIIVDDGSTDGTSEVLRQLEDSGELSKENRFGQVKLQLLFHDANFGKGAALKTGFLAATGDVVGIQDADQEYNPDEFVILISTILADEADVVYGSRFTSKDTGDRPHRSSPGWHRFGNGLITRLSNLKTGVKLTDAETCYKLIRKSVLDKIVEGLTEKRFGIELEMTAKLAKFKEVRFDERPISYEKRTYAEGKKIGIKDGFRAMWCIMKY